MRTADIKKEEQTKAAIIQAAQKMIRAYGFDKTTMEDIARACSMGKSSLYYYYKSREEIFLATAFAEMNELQKKVDTAVAKCKTPQEKFRTLLLTRYYGIKSMMILYSVLLKESTKYIDLVKKVQNTSHKMEIDSITKIVEEGMAQGAFKSVKKGEVHSLAAISMVLWRGLAANIIISGEIPPKSLKIESMVDAFVRGLQ